jgi:hypothetical protein
MAGPQRDRWTIFRLWHREEAFWRDFYLRTVSGLTVVLVVYLVGALTGVFTTQPLPLIFTFFGITMILLMWVNLYGEHRSGRRVRPWMLGLAIAWTLFWLVFIAWFVWSVLTRPGI